MVQLPYLDKPNVQSKAPAALPTATSKRSAAFIHRLLLNKWLRIGILLAAATVVPILIFLIVFARTIGPMESFPVPTGTCSHLPEFRVRCGENLSRALCMGRGCCYSANSDCYHFMPSKHQYAHDTRNAAAKSVPNTLKDGQRIYSLFPISTTSAHGFTMNANIFCEIIETSESRLRVTIHQSMDIVSSAPSKIEVGASAESRPLTYYYNVSSPIFQISIHRTDDHRLLLSTHRGAFVVTLNYIEWSFYLGTDILIGLGDFFLSPGSRTILSTANHPNVPFILAYEPENQQYHGIYVNSLYPIEVEVSESYLVILRGIYDNQSFSVELIVGDDISSMQLELLKLVGGYQQPPARTNIRKYGLHICNSERDYVKVAADLEEYLQPELLQTIPYDSHCLTERVVALNTQLPDEYLSFLERFKVANKSVILNMVLRIHCANNNNGALPELFDAPESCDGILNAAVLTEKSSNLPSRPYRTEIDGKEYVYLDWTSESIQMDKLLNVTRNNLYLGFDGIVLQGNWLQDDQKSHLSPVGDLFPYIPEDFQQAQKGLVPPWKTGKQKNREGAEEFEEILRAYNVYAGQSVRLVSDFLRQEDHQQLGDLFLSSESSPYSNTNTILRGINSSWVALNATRNEILANSMTGLHSTNSNICGDVSVSAGLDELCLRWYQFASLTSIYRALTTVAPHRFNKFYEKAMVRTTRQRYSLSTYFETMQIMNPNRAINTPIFYDYPGLHGDFELNSAWMTVGLSLFAAPVVTPSQHTLVVCLPELSFEFNDGLPIPEKSSVKLSIVQSDLPLFIKAGHIVVAHSVQLSNSVNEARQRDLILLIALLPDSVLTRISAEWTPKAVAVGWLATEKTKLRLDAVQNGPLITVRSSRNKNDISGCDIPREMSHSVGTIKWYGLLDEEGSTYGSVTCQLEETVDLCIKDLNFSINVTDVATNCEFIQY